jgi:hypothetical protein
VDDACYTINGLAAGDGAAGSRRISEREAPTLGMVAENSGAGSWTDLPIGCMKHVEHLVGLVEHEDLGARQHDAALVEVLEQPSRGRNEDVDAAGHGRDLRTVRNAAVHKRHRQPGVAAVGLEALGNLRRQLTRRRQHERTGPMPHRRPLVGGEPLQDRQRERCRLAGARLSDARSCRRARLGWPALDRSASSSPRRPALEEAH